MVKNHIIVVGVNDRWIIEYYLKFMRITTRYKNVRDTMYEYVNNTPIIFKFVCGEKKIKDLRRFLLLGMDYFDASKVSIDGRHIDGTLDTGEIVCRRLKDNTKYYYYRKG